MKLNHISVRNNILEKDNNSPYKICAELNACPLNTWKKSFNNVWHDTKYYSRLKNEVYFKGNVLELELNDSCDIQATIENISNTISTTENLI